MKIDSKELVSCKKCGIVLNLKYIVNRNERILCYLDELRTYKQKDEDLIYFKCPVCSFVSHYKEGEL